MGIEFIAIIMLLAGMSSGQAPMPESEPVLTDEGSAVTFARNISEIKGHLEASMQLLYRLQPNESEFHAVQPLNQYWPTVGPPIEEANQNLYDNTQTVLTGLNPNVGGVASDPQDFEASVRNDVFPLLDDAVQQVVSEEVRMTSTFYPRVMIALLGRINEEYMGGFEANNEGSYREYWDAVGFVIQANGLYNDNIADMLDEEAAMNVDMGLINLTSSAAIREDPSVVVDITQNLSDQIAEATGVMALSPTGEPSGEPEMETEEAA